MFENNRSSGDSTVSPHQAQPLTDRRAKEKPNAQPLKHCLFKVDDAWNSLTGQQRGGVDASVLHAYQNVAPLGSSDLVLIHDMVRNHFLLDCMSHYETVSEAETPEIHPSVYCWRLLSLRKAGKLPPAIGRASPTPITDYERVVAEIVSRRAEDFFQQSLDRILVDEQGRKFWLQAANQFSAELDFDNVRRAALALRKSRRLRPELSARLVDWPIDQRSILFDDLVADLGLVPRQPGVYLFRDESGYLYIGESNDLRRRLGTHAKQSDRASLASYLQFESMGLVYVDMHVFPSDSPGKTLSVRRAYESELIRSRQPRFNLRP